MWLKMSLSLRHPSIAEIPDSLHELKTCTTFKVLQQPVTLVGTTIVTDSVQELLNIPPYTVNKSIQQCLTSYLLVVYSPMQTVMNIYSKTLLI
jgi:hypothetical protein